MWLLRFFNRSKGSISILLTIILLPTLLLSGTLVDLANRHMSKALVEEAGELAAASILAKYDTVLEDVYGIFAISQDYADLHKNVQQYLEDTISSAGYLSREQSTEFASQMMQSIQSGVAELMPDAARDAAPGLIRATVSDVSAGGVADANLTTAAILENQIVEFMKYRGPAEVGLDLLSTLTAFKSLNDQAEVAEKKTEVDEKVAEVSEDAATLYRALVLLDEMVQGVQDSEPNWDTMQDKLEFANEDIVVNLYGLAALDRSQLVVVESYDAEKKEYKFTVREQEKSLSSLPGNWEYVTKGDTWQSGAELVQYRNLSSLTSVSPDKVLEIYEAYCDHMENFVALIKRLDELGKKLALEKLMPINNEEIPELEAEIQEIEEYLYSEQVINIDFPHWNSLGIRLDGYCITVDGAASRVEGYLTEVNSLTTDYRAALDRMLGAGGADQIIFNVLSDFDVRAGNFIQLVLNLIDKVDREIDGIKAANEEFNTSLDEYKGKAGEDSYYTNMSAQAKGNDTLLTHEDLAQLREQVEAIREYAQNEYDKIKDAMFYKQDFPLGIGFSGSNVAKGANELLSEAAQTDSRYAKGAFGLQDLAYTRFVTFPTGMDPMTVHWYMKLLTEPLSLSDGTVPVARAVLTMAAQYGSGDDEDEDDSISKNLKKTASKQSDSSKSDMTDTGTANLASSSVSPYSYTNSVFDGLSGDLESGLGGGVDSDDECGAIKQLKAMISVVKGLVGVLGNLLTGKLENVRDDLLVTEYIHENFSSYYHTTKGFMKDKSASTTLIQQGSMFYPTTMTGVMISPKNNTIYGCEMEYILYGSKGNSSLGPGTNIHTVLGNIYAIRLVCNAIFALTDSVIDGQTIPPAAAIQAATLGVFPMQVAQVILKIGLALLETALDMKKIKAGEKVALIKNRDTWTCSLDGLVRELASDALDAASEKVKDVAKDVIRDLSGRLNTLMSEGIDMARDDLSTVVSDITDDAASTVNGLVNEAISSVAGVVTSYAREYLNNLFLDVSVREKKNEQQLKAEFASGMESAINSAIDGLKADDKVKGILRKVFLTGGTKIMDKIWNSSSFEKTNSGSGEKSTKTLTYGDSTVTFGQLVVKIQNAAADPESATNALVDGCINKAVCVVSGAVEAQVNGAAEMIKTESDKLLGDLADTLKAQSSNMIVAAAEGAEDIVDDCVDEMTDTVSSKLGELFPEDAISVGDMDLGDAADGTASGNTAKTFMAGYDEYLLVFLFLGLCDKDQHDAIVGRIGEVIALNLKGSGGNGGMKAYRDALGISDDAYKDKSFAISKANTYIQIQCTVKVKPVLLSQKLVSQQWMEEINASSFWQYTYYNMAGY